MAETDHFTAALLQHSACQAGEPHSTGGDKETAGMKLARMQAYLGQTTLLGAAADLAGVCLQHTPILLAVLLVLCPRIALQVHRGHLDRVQGSQPAGTSCACGCFGPPAGQWSLTLFAAELVVRDLPAVPPAPHV